MATTPEIVTATTTAPTPTDYVLVNSTELLSLALSDLHGQPIYPPSLYVDLEGTDLCRHGRIALIAIYISPLEKTYLIDVTALGETAFTTPASDDGETTLKALLEDEHTPKVLFDCRNDSDALYNLYKVDISGVHDLQLMELATRRGGKRFLNGLAKVIRDYAELSEDELAKWTEVKTGGKERFNGDAAGTVWEERPLDDLMLRYSVQDVTLLPKLWHVFDAKLNAKWRTKVETEVFWRIQLSRQEMYYGGNKDTATLGPW